MTPEWLGGVYTEDEVRVDLRAWCARTGARFEQGRAVRLDRATRTVFAADGRRFAADVIAVDIGAVNPHAAASGPAVQTKPLHRVRRLAHRLDRFAHETAAAFHLVIVGDGKPLFGTEHAGA